MEIRKITSRNGVALFIILGVLMLLCGLFLFFTLQSRQYRHTSHVSLQDEQIFQAARAFSNVLWMHFQEVCSQRTGCEKLYPTSGVCPLYPLNQGTLENLTISPSDLTTGPRILQAFQELCTHLPQFSNPQAEIRFRALKTSPDAILGQIHLRVSLVFQRENHSFDFPREFKLIRCLPPVVGKFTLFIRDCDQPNRFNTISKGFQDERGTGDVFTLFNTPKPFDPAEREVWKDSGWVYLGGNSVVLHLDGTHPCRKQSDSFLFWPGLYSTSLAQDLPHACSGYLGSTKFRTRVTPLGAMKDWQENSVLQLALGGKSLPYLDKSSCLRLFGESAHPTPTRVFGNVRTDYVLAASLILDEDGDTRPDSVTSRYGVSHPAVFPLPRLTDPAQFRPPAMPRLITSQGFDLFLDGAGYPGFPNTLTDLFPAYSAGAANDYVTLMTKSASDFKEASGMQAYNTLYDQIFAGAVVTGNKPFPAARILPAGDYPNRGQSVSIPLDWTGTTSQFSGNLTTFDPGAFFRQNDIFGSWFENQGEFLREGTLSTRNGVSMIDDPMIARVGGSLILPRPIQANSPAMIVAENDLTVLDVRPSTTDSKLILVSLRGNIRVEGGQLDGVSLVAPEGSVEWRQPLDLKGSLCARSLSPAALEKGGAVVYDPGLDITNPVAAQKAVVFLLGPNVAHVMKAQQ